MDEQRARRLEERLRALEARLDRLEGASPSPAPVVEETATFPGPPPPPVRVAPSSPAPLPAAPVPGSWTSSQAAEAPRWGQAAASATATAAGSTAPKPPSASTAALGVSLRDLEERFAGRALAWAGGLALVAAAIFFLSLAFSRGWISEPVRVLIGLGAAGAALVLGAVFLDRRNALMGNVITAVGLGIASVSLMAATRLYGLIPPELGLAGALVVAIAAAATAIRFDSREVAAFGLIAALVAPPLVDAPPTTLTLAFVAAILAGTTAIALFRSWPLLPAVAFVLAAPQLAAWLLAGPAPAEGLVVLGGFWLINVVAAAGEEIRIRRDDLRPATALLVVANAAFLIWGGFAVLEGDLAPMRGAFTLVAALAHLALGGWLLRRQGLQDLFANLVTGTGVALLALAALVQLGASVVPIAWAAEAVALTWLAVRRRHDWSALAALMLGGLAVAHLVVVEYPVRQLDEVLAAGTAPGVGGATLSLIGVVSAIAVAAAIVPVRWIRSTLLGIAILAVAWAAPFTVAGRELIGVWAVLLPLGVMLDAWLARTMEDATLASLVRLPVPLSPATAAGAVAWSSAAVYALAGPLSLDLWGTITPPSPPFTDIAAVVGALLVGTAVAAAVWTHLVLVRRLAIGAAIVAAAAVVPVEVYADGVSVLWVGLAALAILVAGRDERAGSAFTALAATLMAGAVIVAFGIVAPPQRLVVADPADLPVPLLPLWFAAFGAIGLGLLAAPRHAPLRRWATWFELGAGATFVYAVSIAIVAAFQGMAGGATATEELAKQAQVALSVCWTLIGVIALIVGMRTGRVLVRQSGLALLALATAKVFVIDLASMDVAYRALVLAGLGALLLLSAWLFTRYRSGRPGGSGMPGGTLPGA
jgi:uncharacterized membrane protein